MVHTNVKPEGKGHGGKLRMWLRPFSEQRKVD